MTVFAGTTGYTSGDRVRFHKTAQWNRDRVYTVDGVTGTEVVIRTPMSSGPMSEPYRMTHDQFRELEPELVAEAGRAE